MPARKGVSGKPPVTNNNKKGGKRGGGGRGKNKKGGKEEVGVVIGAVVADCYKKAERSLFKDVKKKNAR